MQNFITNMSSVFQDKKQVKKREVENYIMTELKAVREYEGILEEGLLSLRTGIDLMKRQLKLALNRVLE